MMSKIIYDFRLEEKLRPFLAQHKVPIMSKIIGVIWERLAQQRNGTGKTKAGAFSLPLLCGWLQ
jgi:hypothetical protein